MANPRVLTPKILINGVVVAVPTKAIAYKYADPIEDARWLYDEDDARLISRDDPSLLVWVERDETA